MALASVCGFSESDFLAKHQDYKDNFKNVGVNLQNPLLLAVPPYANPPAQLARFQEQGKDHGIEINFDHGTTTLGFQFKNGVILAVDSRATGGQYIGSGSMKKIVEINKYLLGTLAGGAADCVYWDRVLSRECRLHELRNRERISVASASKIMANIANHYKGTGLSMGMMLAGYDKRGSNLYYIDSNGSRTAGKLFSVGSGSLYAYGVLDSGYKYDLENEDAYELARRSIYHATHRDAYSGGIIRVYHMTKDGFIHISDEDCVQLHYKYQEEKAQNKME